MAEKDRNQSNLHISPARKSQHYKKDAYKSVPYETRGLLIMSPVKKSGGLYRLVSPIDSDQELNDLEVATVLAEGECQGQKYTPASKVGKPDFPCKLNLSPFRPSTVITNLQRGNVQTTTPSMLQNISIHQMAAQGELVLLQQEVIQGANINKIDEQGLTPLLWACANGQLSTVEYLVEKGANLNAQGSKGESALLFASCNGYIDIVKYLLKKNVDVNYTDESGSTALMYATYNNHPSCVKLLLESGVDLSIQNEDHLTAMDIAVGQGHKPVQKVIENHILSMFEETPGTISGKNINS